jgi:hypothetical protein
MQAGSAVGTLPDVADAAMATDPLAVFDEVNPDGVFPPSGAASV